MMLRSVSWDIRKHMTLAKEISFPVYTGPITASPEGTDSPYSIEVMALYLADCHYKYVTEEQPTLFKNFNLTEKLFFKNRLFWVWQCKDGFERSWDIVIGQGTNPIFGASGNSTWMTGDLYWERHSAWEIVVEEFPEHKTETGKSPS